MRSFWTALLGCAIPALGCTLGSVRPDEDGDDIELCQEGEDQPPAPPEVLDPVAGRIDVVANDLTISSSVFSDPDGDAHTATEFEIWRLAAGEPVIRVWRAKVEEAAKLTQVTLVDGTFDVNDTLDEWADYGVQARYLATGSDCSSWSDWSPVRPFRTDDGSTAWFAERTIQEVRIALSQESWDAINAEAEPPGCVVHVRQYYPGTVTIDGQTFEGAGVRAKGGCGSARSLDGKAGFKINLSWDDPTVDGCPDERRIHGLKRITLNNQVQDRSFVHEMLAYHFYKLMGVATPRANHARVYVNDELWGVYLNLESIDRRFLSRWFGSNNGMVYEGAYGCDFVPGNVPPGEEDTTCLVRKFHPSDCEPVGEGGDVEDYTVLRDMVQQLTMMPVGSFYPEVEAIWDFDGFLSLWAADNVLGHWDGYIMSRHNFRIYHDPSSGKWSVIPAGVDQTFNQSSGLAQLEALLADRCWQEPDCQAAYRARVAEAADIFEQANLQAMAEQIRDDVMTDVMADPRKEGSYQNFLDQVTATIDFINRRPGEVRANLGI